MPSVLDFKLAKRPSAAIGIPTTDMVPRTPFYHFLLLASALPAGDRWMTSDETAVVSEARNGIIRAFLTHEGFAHCDYLCLFDSDMVVTADTVHRLVSHGLPFVSAYCTRKQYPFLPIPAILVKEGQHLGEPTYEYKPITSWEPNSGIRECDGVGAAAICVRRDILEQMTPPWFKFEHGGEDYYFCRKVKTTGAAILVDTTTMVGHEGRIVAWPADFFRVKDEYMREAGESEEDILTEFTDGQSAIGHLMEAAVGSQEAAPAPA